MLYISKNANCEVRLMQDILSTFQKHIGEQFEPEIHPRERIHQFGEDIKGANEFIGALQSASAALKKILKIAKNPTIQDAHTLSQDIQEIVENASFMGCGLFDTCLHTTLHSQAYTFSVNNPLPLLPQSQKGELDTHALVLYVEEKIQEANQMLLALNDALLAGTEEDYNFNEFNPKAFAEMFKGR